LYASVTILPDFSDDHALSSGNPSWLVFHVSIFVLQPKLSAVRVRLASKTGLSTRKHWHGWEGEIEMRRHRPRRPTPQLRPKVTRVGQSAAADRPPTMRDRNTGNFTDGQNSD
jgi:hypothetical protein